MAFGAAEPAAPIDMARMEGAVTITSVGAERGALFEYQVAHPISVARGRSAMVPILSARLAGRRTLLYNGRKLPEHPVASVRTRNTTGLTLERGPVTVLEEGAYGGEAVVPFTRAEAELIISYAVELGIKVTEQRRTDRSAQQLTVRGEFLLIDEWETTTTTYTLASTLGRDVQVVVEHLRAASFDLVGDPPAEQTPEFARWPVDCPAGRSVTLAVQERRTLSRRQAWRQLGPNGLQSFLRDRLLDQATFARLREILELYDQIGAAQRRIDELGQERARIYEQQKQIQGSMAPLGREGEEAALRKRYVATLNDMENQLASIAADETRLRQQITGIEAEISRRMTGLS